MARKRNCRDCKKELTDKYFLFTGTFPFSGEEGDGTRTSASRANYCASCRIKWNLPDNKTLLNSIRKARQELEPYLQKPEIDARNKDYKQKVVQPVVEEILGGKLDEEINTELEGHIPGYCAGRAEGSFNINGKSDNKLALQAFLRALTIKEKELKKELPEENNLPTNDDNNSPLPDNSPHPPPKPSSNGSNSPPPNESNYTL
ncbi:1840_t:CDS:2 [Diversispora eburnea]|uniref:1840_t:CDS:1 n=1 Tax=Diversispora eburnea TaxID=1213867 RepID=A0A9N9CEI1_9GLOM|nr:1840_t:CDS:2 [Diversispora eburnea]